MARYLSHAEERAPFAAPAHYHQKSAPQLSTASSSYVTTSSGSSSSRTLSSHELRLPPHARLSPVRSTMSTDSTLTDDSSVEARPVERSVCRNCNFVFLAAYSTVGAAFCSLDCRTSYGLHLSDDEQAESGAYAGAGEGEEDPAAYEEGAPEHAYDMYEPHVPTHTAAEVCAAPVAAYPAPRAADELAAVAPVLRGGSMGRGVCLLSNAQIASLESHRQAAVAPIYRASCESQAYRAGDGGGYFNAGQDVRQRSIRNV